MYVYIKSDLGLYTVGFYGPDGLWHPESDHTSADAAAKRVAWLNGSGDLTVSIRTALTDNGRRPPLASS